MSRSCVVLAVFCRPASGHLPSTDREKGNEIGASDSLTQFKLDYQITLAGPREQRVPAPPHREATWRHRKMPVREMPEAVVP